MADTRTDQEKAKDFMKRLEALKQERAYYEAMVDLILQFVRRARTITDTGKGKNLGPEVYDGTALGALNLWADGMYGYICSPQIDWFSLKLPLTLEFPRSSSMRRWSGKRMDDLPDVSQWLQDTGDVMKSAFLRSNFYASMPQFFRDGGSVGTAVMDVDEDIATGKITFTPMHFREFYVAENAQGTVDTMFREFNYTLKQLVEKFGFDALQELDPNFRESYKSNPFAERTVYHASYPRQDREPWQRDNLNKPYSSEWMLKGKTDKMLLESGMSYFRYIVWRYRKEVGEGPYGRSPSWDAWTEINLGNAQSKTNLTAGYKMADPAMVALDTMRGRVNKLPGSFTYVDRMTDQPVPLQTGVNLPYALDMLERTQKAIEKHFNVDFFLMLSQAAYNKVNLTATQVIQMAGEKAAVLATRTDTLNSEAMNAIIDLVFDIEWSAGRIPYPPDVVLQYAPGGKIEVDYLGPLAQAQKTLFQTQGIRAGLEIAGQIGGVFPEALRVINSEDMMRKALKSVAFPASSIRSETELTQINQAIEQQQAEQQALQQGVEIAKALPGASKAIEAGSPIAGLVKGLTGQEAAA